MGRGGLKAGTGVTLTENDDPFKVRTKGEVLSDGGLGASRFSSAGAVRTLLVGICVKSICICM